MKAFIVSFFLFTAVSAYAREFTFSCKGKDVKVTGLVLDKTLMTVILGDFIIHDGEAELIEANDDIHISARNAAMAIIIEGKTLKGHVILTKRDRKYSYLKVSCKIKNL